MRRYLRDKLILPIAYCIGVALAWKQPAIAARAFRIGTLLRYGHVSVWQGAESFWEINDAEESSHANPRAN